MINMKIKIKINIKKITLSLLSTMTFMASFLTFSFWINVSVPEGNWDEDVAVTGPTVIQTDESDLFELIIQINKYLWFAIGAVCMVVLIIWWFKLMASDGEEEEMKKANNLLMGALAGVVISILSYAAVRLIVNLL